MCMHKKLILNFCCNFSYPIKSKKNIPVKTQVIGACEHNTYCKRANFTTEERETALMFSIKPLGRKVSGCLFN